MIFRPWKFILCHLTWHISQPSAFVPFLPYFQLTSPGPSGATFHGLAYQHPNTCQLEGNSMAYHVSLNEKAKTASSFEVCGFTVQVQEWWRRARETHHSWPKTITNCNTKLMITGSAIYVKWPAVTKWEITKNIIFVQDRTPPHFTIPLRQWLDRNFRGNGLTSETMFSEKPWLIIIWG
jgi:hypothetical protein